MNLLRVAARSMLASYFVVNGVQALRDPSSFAAQQERFTEKVVPLAQKVAPPEVADRIPQDAETLARIQGGLQVLGGAALITGIGRRFGALLIAGSMVPQLMGASTKGLSAAEKAAWRSNLLRDIALVGGALIAAQDTEGRPSLAWRAQDQAGRISRGADKTRHRFEKQTEKQARQFKRKVDKALGN